jgi:hypothetical protein
MEYKHIISLGMLCFGRQFIDYYKIREKFPIRMPFDGAYHSYAFMCASIKNNFQGYLDGVTLKTFDTGKFQWEKNLKSRKRHDLSQAYWGHESKDNFIDFEQTNNLRIKQFNDVLGTPDMSILFFLLRDEDTHNVNIEELHAALNFSYPELKYHVFQLNTIAPNYYKQYLEKSTYLGKPFIGEPGKNFHSQVFSTSYGRQYCAELLEELWPALKIK